MFQILELGGHLQGLQCQQFSLVYLIILIWDYLEITAAEHHLLVILFAV
jgi:hypothetical protein